MKSIWGEEESGKKEDFTGQITAQVGGKRTSRPPEEIYVSRTLTALQGKSNLIEKRRDAKRLLLGEFGLKNRIHAKLLLGPRELEEVIRDPDDLVPALIDLLEERNPNVRTKAAKALGVRGDSRAVARLLRGLSEEKYWIRYEFAGALGKLTSRLEDAGEVAQVEGALRRHLRERGEFSSSLRRAVSRLRTLGVQQETGAKSSFRVAPVRAVPKGEVTLPMRIGTRK